MSLSEGDSQGVLFPSVNSYESWIPRDFPEDLFSETSYPQQLHLTPEEERLFKSFGDGLEPEVDKSLDSFLDDREAVYAEAQAAGLFKGGLRRAAFSMGDLQALQPQIPVSLPSRPSERRNSPGASASSKPRLESVPESKALPDFADDLLLNSSMQGMSTDVLEGLDFPSIPSGPGQFGDSADMRLFGDAEPGRFSADLKGLDLAMPMEIKSEPGLDGDYTTGPLDFGPDLDSIDAPGSHAGFAGFDSSAHIPHTAPLDKVFDYSYLDMEQADVERRPPLPPRSPPGGVLPSSTAPMLDTGLMASSQQTFKDMPRNSQGYSMTTRSSAATASDSRPSKQKFEQAPPPKAKKALHRSQSALELRSMSRPPQRQNSYEDLQKPRFIVELTTPEGHTYTAGRLSNEERAQKILSYLIQAPSQTPMALSITDLEIMPAQLAGRMMTMSVGYRQKRHERNFNKRIKYMCRKTLADSRPRVRGRFARNDDAAAVMPHETKKALAEKARRERKAAEAAAAEILREHDRKKAALRQSQYDVANSGHYGFANHGMSAPLDFSSMRQQMTSEVSELIPVSIPHVDSDPSLSTTTAFTFPRPSGLPDF